MKKWTRSSKAVIDLRLLLDTVAFIWSVRTPERLSRKAMAALERERAVRELSALSLSEIAIKGAKGKLTFSKDDIVLWLGDLQIRVLPYTAEHALRLFELPLHHADPFDRQIIAQALTENIPVVTSDDSFRQYSGLKVIW
jgi:PIN domain nuclease of toxin-antitoxin system